LQQGAADVLRSVIGRITDAQALKRGRIHPIQILSALATYRQGRGARGSGEWPVVPEIVDALDQAFYTSFGSVESTGKRWVLAVDVSGSMGFGSITGVPGLTPRVGSAAMAMVPYRVEPAVSIVAFQGAITPIDLSRRKRLDDVVTSISNLPFGSTDCAQPMLWAMKQRVEAGTVVIYTQSGDLAGSIHPG